MNDIRKVHDYDSCNGPTPNPNPTYFDTFDKVLEKVGPFSLYHVGFICMMQVIMLILCGNYTFMAYATHLPEINCTTSDHQVIEMKQSESKRFCEVYQSGECTELHWNTPFKTIIEEWKLICDMDYVPQMINSIQNSGTVIAMLLTGPLSDAFGRKRVFCFVFPLIMVAISCSAISTDWKYFAFLRFLVGGCLASIVSIIAVWGMEITDQRHNVIMNIAGSWEPSYIITAGIAYITYEWRTYLLVFSLVSFTVLIALPFFVESPRWQVQKGELAKAVESLSRMSSTSKKDIRICQEDLSKIPRETHVKAELCYLTLFTSKRLATYTAVLCLAAFTFSATVDGYIFETTHLSGNPFTKFIIFGIVRSIPPITIYLCDWNFHWFGRRHMFLLSMGLAFLCYSSLTTLIYFFNFSKDSTSFLLLLGSITGGALWIPLAQFTVELYPTVMRNMAGTLFFISGAIAEVSIPQLVYMEKYWPHLLTNAITILTFLMFIIGFVIFPETKGKEIPDTIESVQKPWFLGLSCWRKEEEEENLAENEGL